MPAPVRLQTHVYNPVGSRRALLLHGLGSDGACWWRLASELAEDDYLVVAPDLRSHGRSPAAIDHSLAAFAADVLLLGESYDLVVGHSLGGSIAALLLTRRAFAGAAVLIDPVLRLDPAHRDRARTELRAEVGVLADPEVVHAASPGWDRRDVERKVLAAQQVAPTVVDAVFAHNDPWDVLDTAASWATRVHVLAADPEVATLRPDHLAALPAGGHVTHQTVSGAGHSIHRERPDVVTAAVRLVTHGEQP